MAASYRRGRVCRNPADLDHRKHVVDRGARDGYLVAMEDLFSDQAIRGQRLTRGGVESLLGGARHLIDCDLEEADLSRLDLSRWTFERCNLRRADCAETILEGTHWQSCRGAFASFTGGDLSDATFIASDFNNSSFKRATLESAKFVRCKLTGADLTRVKAVEIHFDETLLINAKLLEHSFRDATLKRIDFAQADLRKADFRRVRFEECSLREASLEGARFEGADLRGADLGGVRLIDAALFRGATISREQAGQLLSELGINVR